MARFHKLVNKSENTFAKWAGTWDVEIAAVAFSCLTLAAMIALLIAGNDKPVWIGVTLNTYVSILATASKVSALFALSSAIAQTKWNSFRTQSGSLLEFEAIDLASRGALGCIQLLCQTRHVAFIGAVTFILAFAFDPFTQQLIQLKSETAFAESSAVSAPITMRYSGGSHIQHPMEVVGPSYRTALDSNVDYAMQSSILSGLVQDPNITTQQLLVGCPSGNCTWAPVRSLAICNRCADLGSMLRKSVSSGVPLPFSLDGNSPTMQANSTRYSLPNGLYIEDLDGLDQMHMTTFGTGLPKDTNQMKGIDTLLWSTTVLKSKRNPSNSSARWPDLPIQAIECGLYYCVKEYNTTMEGNRIQQTSGELTNFVRDSQSWQAETPPSDESDPETVVGKRSTTDSISWSPQDTTNRTDLSITNGTQHFNISFDAVRSISQYFWASFSSNTSIPRVNGYYMDIGYGSDFVPIVSQIFYETDDLGARFETLALSMSNAIRMRKADSTDVNGKLGRPVTKYRIEWPWITMPVIIVAATLVQLILTIRGSRTRPILKLSILAVLSRGAYVGSVFDGAETVKNMRDAPAHENVCLFEMTEPMMSPRHTKKFSIGSSYTSLSSPGAPVDGVVYSPLNKKRRSHWTDDSTTVNGDGFTDSPNLSHGLGITSDDGSRLVSPRRALLSSWHERSISGASAESQESHLLRELQDDCAHFRGEDRGSR